MQPTDPRGVTIGGAGTLIVEGGATIRGRVVDRGSSPPSHRQSRHRLAQSYPGTTSLPLDVQDPELLRSYVPNAQRLTVTERERVTTTLVLTGSRRP